MKTAIPINLAIRYLIDNGFTPAKAKQTIEGLKQPCKGFVYALDIPKGE